MARALLYWIPALVALALLSVFCIRHHGPLIAEDLKTRSRLALNEADLSGVEISRVDGLDVILTGEVANSGIRERAVSIVSGVHGVHSVVDEMTTQPVRQLAVPTGRHQFSAMATQSEVELTGMVRDAEMRASIVGAARRAFGERRVIDRLEVVASVPAQWTPVLRDLLEQLAGFSSGKLDIRGTHLSLAGSVNSRQRKDIAEVELSRVAADVFTSRLDVAVLAPADEVIQNCQSTINARLESASVEFNSGSATISVDSYPLLEDLADIISSCEGTAVEIQGHTDSDGSEQGNLALSDRRAQAVLQYLVEEGIDARQLSARGYGEAQPRADNSTRDGRARNRRIEFVISGN